ncbi:DinB family protein [Candidatus Palauibacter sp.]|uniref:DinB family protein n=1 Tax=Candidatus Palauibacter sp. TaxID=3101350 RepID=UPI003C6F9758
MPARRTAWSPGRHAAHLAAFEREAVRPRIEGWLGEPGDPAHPPAFDGWRGEEPAPEAAFEAALEAFAEQRRASLAALPQPLEAALGRRARIGDETLTLYQFLRGVAQHDAAHEMRIRERVHPALLAGEDA